jgi:protein involved in temperature-dependent protein secretion
METAGQLHPHQKSICYTFNRMIGVPQTRFTVFGEQKKPQILGCPARSVFTALTELPGSAIILVIIPII